MRLSQVLKPKRPANLNATAIFSLLLMLTFVACSWFWVWNPKRGLGLAFGIAAALLFLFEMAYPSRRPRARPLRTAQRWVQAHIYLGVIALVCVLMHTGFHLPHGGIGWWLLLLSAWTTFSGLLGVLLQKWIPASLAEGLRVEALYERIPALVAGLLVEADNLTAEAGDVLERFYRTDVRPHMVKVEPSWGFLLDVQGGRERALEPFRRMTQFVDEVEKQTVTDLMTIYTEKMELDAQYSLQGILRRWLVLHVPAAGLLMGLLAIHVFTWAWY